MLRYAIFLVFFSVGAAVVYFGGQRGALAYQQMLTERVRHGLDVLGADWVSLKSDGMRISLHGRAPSPEAQALAIETAQATAPRALILNVTSAVIRPAPPREPIALEVHRDSMGVTVTGRMAGEEMQARFAEQLAKAVPDLELHDFSGRNGAPPETWGREFDLAVAAVAQIPNAYVKITPGSVRIEGALDDADAIRQLQGQFANLAGETVTLALDLRIPPQVIIPYRFAAWKDFGGLRVETCAARDEAERVRILAALSQAGGEHHPETCPVALGGPEGAWPAAISAALSALDALPTARIEMVYRTMYLEAAPPTEEAAFEAARGALEAALPEGFALDHRLIKTAIGQDMPRDAYWLSFRDQDAGVLLTGRMPGQAELDALTTFAAALYGGQEVAHQLTVTATPPPPGWYRAAQEVLAAMAAMEGARAEVTAGRVSLSGRVASPDAAGQVRRDLSIVLPGFELATEIEVDLPGAIRSLPLIDAACIAEMNRVIQAQPITFETGSAVIDADSQAVVDLLASTYGRCDGIALEISGHTDSQGSETFNQQLSQSRAEAVLDALLERAVPLDRLRATGYGESRPKTSNETEEGRAANRRIEFSVVE